MATEVKVPSMGESITSGILSAWLVKDGDFVEKDQPIYELETDKITSEATAEVSGIIQFKVEQDAEVDIGATVATIDDSAKAPTSNDAPKVSEVKEPVIESSAKTSKVPSKKQLLKSPKSLNIQKKFYHQLAESIPLKRKSTSIKYKVLAKMEELPKAISFQPRLQMILLKKKLKQLN